MRTLIFLVFFVVGFASTGLGFWIYAQNQLDAWRLSAIEEELPPASAGASAADSDRISSFQRWAFAAWRGMRGGVTKESVTLASIDAEDEVDGAVAVATAFALDLVRVDGSGTPLLVGRAEPLAEIILLAGEGPIARVTASRTGEFVLMPETTLAAGSNALRLQVRTAAADGSNGQTSEMPLSVTLPEDDDGELIVALGNPVAVDATAVGSRSIGAGDPSGASRRVALSEPTARSLGLAEGRPSTLRVDAVEASDGRIYVAGAGAPGSRLRVAVDEDVLGAVDVGTSGRWILEADGEIELGSHSVRADQLGGAGKLRASASAPFIRRTGTAVLAPVEPVAAADGSKLKVAPNIIIRRGDSLWSISRRTYGKGERYPTIYEANGGQIRNPDLIYPGQVFQLPTRDRAWELEESD